MADILKNDKPTTAGDPAALEAPNYISQINAGGTLYDIATHHGITFYSGATDSTGVVWNGVTDLKVRIPVITDLVKTPIQFAGTVDETGQISYNSGVEAPPKAGYLVFITKDCSFNDIACEAGDMAVYDGSKWNVVTGENQVEILNVGEDNAANVVLNATAKEVLRVEGKTLKLSIDYKGVEDVMSITKNSKMSLEANDGTATVAPMYIKLTKADDTTSTIGETKSLNIPTELEDGTVTINEKVLAKKDIAFSAGTLPTIKMNDAAIGANVNNTLSVGKKSASDGVEGDYVAAIDGAIKSATLTTTDTAAGATLSFVKELTSSDGDKFVNGVHVAASEDEKVGNGDFVIPGKVSMTGKKFVTGLEKTESGTGDVLSSVSIGAVSIGAGSDVVTGLDTEKLDATGQVMTSVTIGNAVQDTAASWFYSGLGAEKTSDFDVVTNVKVGDVSLVADAASSLKKNVLESAKVEDHVLSFGSVDVSAPVKVNQAGSTISGKSFTQSGVKLTGFAVKSADLKKGGIAQAESTFMYKSFATDSDVLTYGDDTKYYLDKAAGLKYTANMGYAKFDTVNSTITKNTPELKGNLAVSIPTEKVAVGFAEAGQLPSLSVADIATGVLTGSVNTGLTTKEETFTVLKSADISVSGAYSLETPTEASAGAIEVAKSGTYGVTGAHCDIDAGSFVTDVAIKK